MTCSEKQIRKRFVCALVLILVMTTLFFRPVRGAAAYMQAQSYICNTFTLTATEEDAGESEIEAQHSAEDDMAGSESCPDGAADTGVPADENGSDEE